LTYGKVIDEKNHYPVQHFSDFENQLFLIVKFLKDPDAEIQIT
jgi:hypothetical protein